MNKLHAKPIQLEQHANMTQSHADAGATRLRPWSMGLLWAAALLVAAPAPALAQATLSATRTSSFTYYGSADGALNGLLKSETVEPDTPNLCMTTSYVYDGFGNKQTSTVQNCAGASGRALFTTHSNTTAYPSSATAVTVTVGAGTTTVLTAAGQFVATVTNSLSQSESRVFDPRFGLTTSLTGPNKLTLLTQVDDFGRKTKDQRSDGTSIVTAYCWLAASGRDLSSNSSTTNGDPLSCPAQPSATEVPADAAFYTYSVPLDAGGNRMGAFVRTYNDRLGREIRTVTESFDGAAQPAAAKDALVVSDTVFNVWGAKAIQTQPYLLASGSTTTSGSNDFGYARTDFDDVGRPLKVYAADANATNALSSICSTSAGLYCSLSSTVLKVSVSSFAYNGLSATMTNDKGQARTEEKNVNGETIRVTDALNAQIAYRNDAFGNLLTTLDALQNKVSMTFDVRGRKLSLTDPDKGATAYDYDAISQMVWQRTANQVVAGTQTTFAYDALGRMISRVEPEYTSNWYYEKNADGSLCMSTTYSATAGIGKLCESSTTGGLDRKYSYDAQGRTIGSRTTIANGPSFGGAVTYDPATGQLATMTYPTGVKVGYSYTPTLRFMQALTLQTAATVTPTAPSTCIGGNCTLAAGTVLWQAQVIDARGHVEQQAYGNNVAGTNVYEPATGRLVSTKAGIGGATTVLNQTYSWDTLSNLNSRTDGNGDGNLANALSETFLYDGLNRLTSYSVSDAAIPGLSRTVNLAYNALGLMLSKSDVGNYTYGAQATAGVKPHALKSVAGAVNSSFVYDDDGNLTSSAGGKYRSLTYTSFDLPDGQSGAQGAGGSPKYTWQYDESHARVKEVHVDGSGTRTTWYLHPDNRGGLGFESEVAANGTVSNRHYVGIGGQAIGVLISQGALPTLAAGQMQPPALGSVSFVKVEYWHKDHLGSLVTTTDHAGVVTARYSYDPFGKRRLTTGAYDASGNLVVDWSNSSNAGTDRGFTGHEQLDDVGLIHMNGRIFDPLLGRFLQADPFVQDAGNLQNYDRFGYCYSNPMLCTDPSGYKFFGKLWDPVGFVGTVALDPMGAYITYRLAHTAVGYQVGSMVIGYISTFCNAGAALCNAVGQHDWAVIAGYSSQEATRIGIFAGISTYMNGFIGDNFGGFWSNTLAHAAWGCVESRMQHGSCKSGAISGGVSAAWANSGYGDVQSSEDPLGAVALNTFTNAAVGGLTSVAAGGRFAEGARSAAYGYLFNTMIHKATEARALFGKGTEGTGHHWVPFGSTTDIDISDEARTVFGQTTNGLDLPDSVHRWDPEHVAYNAAVRAELLQYAETQGIDLATMTADQARTFVGVVKGSNNPAISSLVRRIEMFMASSPRTQALIRRLSAIGMMGAAEWFYPSPMRAPQCQFNPNIDGC